MDSICTCNGSREEGGTGRKGHIPESKQRWEGVIFGESSRGHSVQKQHYTPCGVQGQSFMEVSSLRLLSSAPSPYPSSALQNKFLG